VVQLHDTVNLKLYVLLAPFTRCKRQPVSDTFITCIKR